MMDAETWTAIAAIIAVPLTLFAAIEGLRHYEAHQSRVISTRTRISRRRR